MNSSAGFFFIFALCATAPCWAQEPLPSLFFTPDEVTQVEAEIAARPNAFAGKDQTHLHLDSLLYFGPDRWSAWLQGERWTPTTQKPSLHIVSVNPDSVTLALPAQGSRPAQTVVLHVHQSVDLSTGKISEGRGD